MKNPMKIDFMNNNIVMTKAFAKRAEDIRSQEYAQLQQARRDYPTYTIEIRSIKKNSKKESYAGLTYDYMRDYILTHESKDNVKAALNELEEMILISKCHSQAFRYPTIKKWFLKKYPKIAEFGVDTTEEIQETTAEIITPVPNVA